MLIHLLFPIGDFLDQMKNKLQFNVDDLDKYTIEELKQQVDQAIGQVKGNYIA